MKRFLMSLSVSVALLRGGANTAKNSKPLVNSAATLLRNQRSQSSFVSVIQRLGTQNIPSTAKFSTSTLSSSSSATNGIGVNISKAKEELRLADAVCFDVDSTVCTEEGIDVLAEYLGKGEAVAKLTSAAMDGGTLFQDALRDRLALLQPSKQNFVDCHAKHPPQFCPNVQKLISKLNARNTDVYLVSGGFRIMIEPIADILNIPHTRIYANNIFYNADGSYNGFDDQEPTSRDGGKPKVMKMLIDKFAYKHVVMIGDGATDLQARPPAHAMIGYGGIAQREKVINGADWFVHDFKELIDVIDEEN